MKLLTGLHSTCMVLGLLDEHAPLRCLKKQKPSQPWFTNALKTALMERDIAYHSSIRRRTDENHHALSTDL